MRVTKKSSSRVIFFSGKSYKPTSHLPSRGPKRGRKCYATPALSRIPKQTGTKSELATSHLPSRGPKRGQKCNITPAFLGVPKQRGAKSELAASHLPSQGPKRVRKCYITLHSWGSPNKGGQNQKWLPHPCLLRGPQVGRNAMSPLHSRGSPMPSAGTKSEVAHRWAHRLHSYIFSKIGNCFFAVRSCIFFIFAVNTCRKKLSHRAIFFCGKRVYKKIVKLCNFFAVMCVTLATGLSTLYSAEASLPSSGVGVA